MKILKDNREEGGTLVVTLVTCLIIGVVLGSYLELVSSRYKITVRSQCWNAAIPVAEQGVEEAMAHLVDDSDPAANDWALGTNAGQTVYSKQRTNADGSYFLANLYNTGTNNPFIYSTGFVPSPLQSGSYIFRTVKVTCANAPLFSFAFAAEYAIQMNGSGLAADSFNSSLTTLSTNGQYDPSKTSTNGNVASVYGPVNFGNHTISGSLYLGPQVTTSSVGPGQVSGQIYSDFNVSFPDVTLPSTLVSPPPAPVATVNGISTYYFTVSGDYYVTSGSKPIIVAPGVTVRVRVDATSFSPANLDVQYANGISGSMSVYQVSGSASIAASLAVESGKAQNFYYYGLPAVTSVTAGGNSSWVGVIYAPEADLTLNGGGGNNGLIGACVTKTITMNGHYNFHFDEALLTIGPMRPYTPASWDEI